MSSKVKFAVSTGLSVILALALSLLVLAISHTHNHKWDLTESRRFSLAEQSRQVVQDLKAPVEALVFLAETDQVGRSQAEQLLENYKLVDPAKFSYRFVDFKKSPSLATQHEIRMHGPVVLLSGQKKERVSAVAEEPLTNGMLKLSEIQARKLYLVTGHKERSREASDPSGVSQFLAALAKEGYQVGDLNLSQQDKVPADAAAVLLLGPTSGLLPAEEKTLRAYLTGGGHAALFLDVEAGASYAGLLKAYGLELPEELILDQASQMFGAEPVYPVGLAFSQQSPITQPFLTGRMNTIFGMARPVLKLDPPPQGATLEQLVQTGPEAVTVTLQSVQAGANVTQVPVARSGMQSLLMAGSYPVGAAKPAEGAEGAGAPQTRLVVSGDVDFLSDQMLALYGNRDLALNLVNWLSESERRITLRPKDAKGEPLVLTQAQATQMWLLLVLGIPGGIVVVGAMSAFRRR